MLYPIRPPQAAASSSRPQAKPIFKDQNSVSKFVERALVHENLLQRLARIHHEDMSKYVETDDVKRVALEAIFIICSTAAKSIRKTLSSAQIKESEAYLSSLTFKIKEMMKRNKKDPKNTPDSFIRDQTHVDPELLVCIRDLQAASDKRRCEKNAKDALAKTVRLCKMADNYKCSVSGIHQERYTNFSQMYEFMGGSPVSFYTSLKYASVYIGITAPMIIAASVGAILDSWNQDDKCWYVLGTLFDKDMTALVEDMITGDKRCMILREPTWVSYMSDAIGIPFKMMDMQAVALFLAMWLAGIAIYKNSLKFYTIYHLDKFSDAFFETYKGPPLQTLPEAGHVARFPAPQNDERFAWVSGAAKRGLLLRFSDRCRYQASGTEEGANVDLFTYQAFDEIDDPLLLDNYVQLASGHCYNLESMQEQIRVLGRHAKDPAHNTLLTSKERDLIDAMGKDQSVNAMKCILAFSLGGLPRGLRSQIKKLCKELRKPVAPARGPFMIMHTSTKTYPIIQCGILKVQIGILRNSNLDEEDVVTLFFPNNRAGMRLVSMLVAISSLISTPDHAKSFLSVLKAANGDRDLMAVSDIVDSKRFRSGNSPFIAVMHAIHAMYKI
jgi:hypothetical protein